MSPTTLIIEVVLIGFQSLIWLSFVVFTFFGYEWIRLDLLREWNVQVSAALVGIAYMLGQIFDRLASAIGDRIFLPHTIMTYGASTTHARMKFLVKNHEVHEYFERRRNQNRLLRATFFNLVLISLSAFVFIAIRVDATWKLTLFTCVLSFILLGITFFAWYRSSWILFAELRNAYFSLDHELHKQKGIDQTEEQLVKTEVPGTTE